MLLQYWSCFEDYRQDNYGEPPYEECKDGDPIGWCGHMHRTYDAAYMCGTRFFRHVSDGSIWDYDERSVDGIKSLPVVN